MTNKNIAIGLVALAIGLAGGLLGNFAWLGEFRAGSSQGHADHGGHDDHQDDFERGPHGGRLLWAGDYGLEITIYEAGVPPQFRVFAYEHGQSMSLDDIELTIGLGRLGGRFDAISFTKEGEYLLGDKTVAEPHSFDVKVNATIDGQTFDWQYSTYEGRVVLSDAAARRAGIEVRQAGGEKIVETLALRGEIVLNADAVAHIVPRVSGQVREVYGHLGDEVIAGQVLAVIDSKELAETKADDLAAEARLSLMRASLARVEKLFEKKIAPEQELLTARQQLAEADIEHRTAEAKLHALGFSQAQVRRLHDEKDVDYSRYEIKAPFGGTIIRKHAALGEVVGPESDMFVLADLSTVWADLTVYQKDTTKVRLGQSVTVSFGESIPDAEGAIDYLTPVVDELTRTATARAVLDNKDRQWRPGLFVTAKVVESEARVQIAVPTEAIQTFRDWSVVFVNVGDTYQVRPLELGRSDGRVVEVLQGLSAGESYVAKNSFVLKAEIGKAGATHAH